jgi:hypothetical protein
MKVGDLVPVTINGDVAAQAKITDMEDGIATLIIPGTKVQMRYVTQLTAEPAPVAEPSTQTIITGVDRVDGDGNIIDSQNAQPVSAGESAPVGSASTDAVENAGTVETSTETPTGEATQTQLVEPEKPVETVVETPSE